MIGWIAALGAAVLGASAGLVRGLRHHRKLGIGVVLVLSTVSMILVMLEGTDVEKLMFLAFWSMAALIVIASQNPVRRHVTQPGSQSQDDGE